MRQPDIIVRGLGRPTEEQPASDMVSLLVNGDGGWEEREVDLAAISKALAGKTAPVRDSTLTALIRVKIKDIKLARNRGATWLQICDAFVDSGVPFDPNTIRKLYWRITQEKHPQGTCRKHKIQENKHG